VIEDAKRNDIGSTAQAYADGHLGKVDFWVDAKVSSFDVDAITVNAYLGSDGVKPFVENCKEHGKGMFVLVKTSNTSSGEIQDIKVCTDEEIEAVGYIPTVFTRMADLVNGWGQEVIGQRGYSSVGEVIGATYPEQAETIRKLMKKAIILVPGYGAQGASAKEVIPNFNDDGYGAIINSSREIIYAYQRKFQRDESDFDGAAREAALFMKDEITSSMKEAGILKI
jgi:orotidine-5'-phosphate decarboxylase